jgi:hypothetical protein
MKKIAFLLFFIQISIITFSQKRELDYFLTEGLKNNPALLEINNLQQYFQIQNEFITAQNKKPQIGFTADYLFAPFFFDNGIPINSKIRVKSFFKKKLKLVIESGFG